MGPDLSKVKKTVVSALMALALSLVGGVALTTGPAAADANSTVYHDGFGSGVSTTKKITVHTIHGTVKKISKGQYASFADVACPPASTSTTKYYLRVLGGTGWKSYPVNKCVRVTGVGTYKMKIHRALLV